MDETQLVAATVMLACSVTLFYYVSKDRLVESFMSKKKMRTRHRQVRSMVEDGVTEALELKFKQGLLTEKERDFYYAKFRSVGLREVGTEPTFGKPWYIGVGESIASNALKAMLKVQHLRRKKTQKAIEEDSDINAFLKKLGNRS